ncbi:MAG: flap endonuclease-1 [Candidatus Odinarchaeia archaeon]
MGVNIKGIIHSKQITFEDLSGKIIAIDAYNTIYQFLSIIRQYDGKPLIDRKGFITSHLSGLFYRTINLMEYGIKPVYVFDGEPPSLKNQTLVKRAEIRDESEKKWMEALEKGDLVEAKKFAQASSKLSGRMVDEAKQLLNLMGVPFIEAPSEGEAQAAFMNTRGDVWACGSQDWDSLLFGCQHLVRNITISGRRKLPGKNVYVKIEPELVELKQILKDNGITREQLIDLAILIGTDYNEGIKGIGAKTGLKLIKEFGRLEKVLENKNFKLDFDFNEIRSLFLNPMVKSDYEISWRSPDKERLIYFLHEEHNFSLERVNKAIDRLIKIRKADSQHTLDSWFG